MARPLKNAIDYFPEWNITRSLKRTMDLGHIHSRYAALRNSSSGFTCRKEVRDFIFSRDGHRCVNCGSEHDLTIDHKVSIYAAAHNEIGLHELNTAENLQTMCRPCNSAKKP